MLGDCRHYSFLTSRIADETFGFKSSVASGYRHSIAQVRFLDRLNLIDQGRIVTSFNGQPLDSKDRIDGALVSMIGHFTAQDITVDPEKNSVVYINKYNNFSGFLNQLQNWNNMDRTKDFFEDQDLSLFSHVNAKGALYGTVERSHWGLEGYCVLGNNQYNGFLKGAQGFNLAGYLPAVSQNNKWRDNIFANLGLYRTMMSIQLNDSGPRSEIRQNSLQLSLEDYLKYSFNSRLSGGVIGFLNINRDLSSYGGTVLNKKFDGGYYVSPFLSYDFSGRLKMVIAAEITNTMALPVIWQFTAIPWMQLILKNKNFSNSLRVEYQPASVRADYVSSWHNNNFQVQVRGFAEKYTADFKATNLYRDALGAEIGLGQKIKFAMLFTTITGQSDNSGNKNIFLNVGIKF
jgi:hypothetical protein